MSNLHIQLSEIDRFVGRYALGHESGQGSNHFLRIKVVGGVLTIEQAKVIAEISEKYGRGYLEVTTRHDIQLHWIRDEDSIKIFEKLEGVGLYTDMCGQHYPGAGYGDVRNITTCPFTGILDGELFETYTIVRETVQFFTGKKEYLNLPRKFKIGITSCPNNCIRPEVNDLALIAVKKGHELGFTPFIGGSLGYPPILAEPLNIFIPLNDTLKFIKAVIEIYNQHGFRERKSISRFKWLVKELGTEKIRELIKEYMNKSFQIFNSKCLNISWRDHDTVLREKNHGLYSLTMPTFTGLLSVYQFKEIISISEQYSNEVRVSPSQKLIIPHIPEGELDKVRLKLKKINLDPDQPPIKYMVRACPSNFCGKAIKSSKDNAYSLMDYLEEELGEQFKKLKIWIAISGCPNGCAQHIIADIGLQNVVVRKNGQSIPCFNIYVRGRSSKLSQLLLKNAPQDLVNEVVRDIIKTFINSGYESFNEFAEELLRGRYTYDGGVV